MLRSTSTARTATLLLLAAGSWPIFPAQAALAGLEARGAETVAPDFLGAGDLHLVDPGQLQFKYPDGPAKQADLDVAQDLPRRPKSPVLTATVESLTVFLLWSNYNRLSGTKEWANVTPASVRTNFTSRWVLDDNEYYVNQMGHPYQGSFSFGAARSAGLGFWASSAYPFAFSALWELAGETERPALNDQITTTVGGIVLGEVLYRASDWIRGDGRSLWRQAVATLLSPVSTVNRTVVAGGDPEPPGPVRLSAGVGALASTAFDPSTGGVVPSFDLKLTHGIPGSPGWRYDRPFDHFDTELLYAASPDPVFSLRARGLVVGREFAEVPSGGGLWGLWLSFDLLGPGSRRVSTSALGVGATGRWALGPALTVEGTAVGSAVLLGASGVTTPVGDRSYRFGPGAQGVLETSLTLGDRFRAGLDLRPYLVVAAGEPGGRDLLLEGEATARWRIWGHHALEASTTRTVRWATEVDGQGRTSGATQLMLSWCWAIEPLGAGVTRG
jgi:hypothetical protein